MSADQYASTQQNLKLKDINYDNDNKTKTM